MNPVFSWFEVIVLIGVVQGFLISGLILSRKDQPISKRLLSAVLIVFSLLCVRIMILTTGLWQTPLLRYFPLPFELAIAPLFWLYIRSLVDPHFSLNRKVLLHFIPFGISLVYSIVVYSVVLREAGNLEKDVVAGSFLFDTVKSVEDYLCILSSVIYWFLGFRLIIRYRLWLSANISSTDFPTYAWLKNIALLMGLVIGLLSTDILLDSVFNLGAYRFTHWKFFFIYSAVLIYYLGFRGYLLPVAKAFASPVHTATISINTAPGVPDERKNETFLTMEKRTKLTREKIAEVETAIREAMETHALYLDPELSLEKLARSIGFAPAAVSGVINMQFKKSFRALVNEYRVNCVKERLADRRYDQLSLLGLAYECGFNSEASFYRIFKLITGMPPLEYLRSIGQTR